MANAEQLSILKRGVEAWNGWRAKNIYVYTDLNQADLNGANLSGADLRIAHLRRADLFRADLRGANLSGADLSEANLTKANLNGASLGGALVRDANLSQANLLAANLRNANFRNANITDVNLTVADLEGADLSGANLSRANLTNADLSGIHLLQADLSRARLTRTNLTQANLIEAKFIEADLIGTNVSQASAGGTVFTSSDLSRLVGLESVDHRGPSHLSMDTFTLSSGRIPEVFLRGCGLSDADIEYAKLSNPDLGMDEIRKILHKIQDLHLLHTPQSSPLFISYSYANSQFVDKLGRKLDEKGIRYWREVHERNPALVEKQTDRAISPNSKIILILSEDSVKTNWIEHEINEAMKQKRENGRHVLNPVALDDRWKDSRAPKQVMEQLMEYHIFDFSAWRNNSIFDELFSRLMDGLELFRKG
jgi:uncharacterized protein YjbI with pentapeptide repeats